MLVENKTAAAAPPRHDTERTVTDLDLLRTMQRVRAFEEHLAAAFKDGALPTEAIHLSIGQEAVAAGVCLNLRDSDYLNTTHRGHGHIIAKGADLDKVMAELYGKSDGLCRGKGGSMHVTDAAIGILGANGIVGAPYLLALGAAFAIRHHAKSDGVSVAIAGDGSVNQGMFHEAMNMAALMRLPLLTVIENNLYGEFTPIDRHSAVDRDPPPRGGLRHRIRAHRRQRPRGVFETVGRLVAAMRRDGRPRLLECMTYRWHGHMEGEAESYRSAAEKEEFKKRDPIARLEAEIIASGQAKAEALANLKQAAGDEVAAAVEFAHRSAPPPRGGIARARLQPGRTQPVQRRHRARRGDGRDVRGPGDQPGAFPGDGSRPAGVRVG